MPRNQLASLLVMLIWIAAFTPIGSSVYNPSQEDVQQLGGEKSTTDEPVDPPADPEPDDEN